MITNQSTSDQKFYSYDLSYANYKLSDGTNGYDYFIVDNNGSLQYNAAEQKLPASDRNNLNNVKTEIESKKEVTSFIPYNSSATFDVNTRVSHTAYSISTYGDANSNECFDNNSNWKFIQFGGVEKHIDLSSQTNASEVENYQDLSESCGLYYIAKAVRNHKIDQAISTSLANYFISQSSLKDSINKTLVNQIISLLTSNDDIYNFIYNMPFSNSSKNYSLNFIFDNDNNLVDVYYNQWSKDNVNSTLDYSYSHTTAVIFGRTSDESKQYNLFNWRYYAADWDTFTKYFYSFTFNNSYVSLQNITYNHNIIPTIKTSDVLTNQGSGNTNSVYNLVYKYHSGRYHYSETFDLNIWHDDNYIYFKWFLTEIEGGSTYEIQLHDVTFNNIMN